MQPLRFLCIEDDALNRRVLSDMLNVAGGVTDECANGEDGLAQLDANEFDCVLVDLRMPGMDGHTVIERIRGRGDAKARLPIVVITAEGSGPGTARCLRSGADRVLGKPVVMDELFKCIGEILGAGGALVM
ncbi:response regulator [Sphingomonas glacialis]|uniref:Response regulator n=1 Tax=Sphingomonas glacialis TaxID=658225 RepID=A0A502FRT3_9SPHN|nr:response regulator [Sphingomonas glacialis]TPG52154.1 response regulator [Sphingomonas glacialis]